MAPDKFTATWVSHSSIADFLNCPRAYFLKNVYKDPQTGHKIQITSPALSLGSAVHEVLEGLSVLPTKDRFRDSLLGKFNQLWAKYTGKKGGFTSSKTEDYYLDRGRQMLKKVEASPGPLLNLAVKIGQDLPYFWLSEDDNLILSGKIDWLEYFKDTDSVRIIDFKTSKRPESDDSLQLPIYLLLASRCQNRPVSSASYWYLGNDAGLQTKALPQVDQAFDQVIRLASQIKLARQLERFKCPTNGCRHCLPYEQVISGKAEFVGLSDYNRDLYLLPVENDSAVDSTIL